MWIVAWALGAPSMVCTEDGVPTLSDRGATYTDTTENAYCYHWGKYRVFRTTSRGKQACWGVQVDTHDAAAGHRYVYRDATVYCAVDGQLKPVATRPLGRQHWTTEDEIQAQMRQSPVRLTPMTTELRARGRTLTIDGKDWDWAHPAPPEWSVRDGQWFLHYRDHKHPISLSQYARPTDLMTRPMASGLQAVLDVDGIDRMLMNLHFTGLHSMAVVGRRLIPEDSEVELLSDGIHIDGLLWDGTTEPSSVTFSEGTWHLRHWGMSYPLSLGAEEDADIRLLGRMTSPKEKRDCFAVSERTQQGQHLVVVCRRNGTVFVRRALWVDRNAKLDLRTGRITVAERDVWSIED